MAAAWAQTGAEGGFYLDQRSYAPGDDIVIYASAEEQGLQPTLRLVSIDGPPFTEYASTVSEPLQEHPLRLGSFVDLPDTSLAGRDAFTLEGWWAPTLLGGDTVVVAGHHDAADRGSVALLVDGDGRAGFHLRTSASDTTEWASTPLPAGIELTFLHLALRYDGSQVELLVDGRVAASAPSRGLVDDTPTPFRIGASADAPGDLTGVIDGRLDGWSLWSVPLDDDAIEARIEAGRRTPDATPTGDDLVWHLPLDDAHGTGVHDHTGALRGTVVNHGIARRSGVHPEGTSLQLNHDQLVDAGYPERARLRVPEDLPSGLYSVQVVIEGEADPDHELSDLHRAVLVRPSPEQAGSIAAIAPTNTWTAYNDWPGDKQTIDPEYPSGVTPRVGLDGVLRPGGNNSVYGFLGDGITPPALAGRLRPMDGSYGSVVSPFYSHRAPSSARLARWLDAEGFDVDWYSDEDLHADQIPSGEGNTWLFHAHAEYWTDEMVDATRAHLDAGGHIIAMAGNMFQWRTVYGADGATEVIKWPQVPLRGAPDTHSGIDERRAGAYPLIDQCDGTTRTQTLGTVQHMISPCQDSPDCFGLWEGENTDHWLYSGIRLPLRDRFGRGWLGDGTVGHETDQPDVRFPVPGLVEGSMTVLARGVRFRWSRASVIVNWEANTQASCEDFEDGVPEVLEAVRRAHEPDEPSGQIVTWDHEGGGQVLVLGSTDSLHALDGRDGVVAGIVRNALDCYALGDCPTGGAIPRACGCHTPAAPGLGAVLFLALGLIRRRTETRRPTR